MLAASLFLCVTVELINITVFSVYIFFSIAVKELQSILSMRCRFMRRSVIKFVFMLLTAFAIATLFVNEHIQCRLDHPSQEDKLPIIMTNDSGQEDELPIIVTETSKRNRFLGE